MTALNVTLLASALALAPAAVQAQIPVVNTPPAAAPAAPASAPAATPAASSADASSAPAQIAVGTKVGIDPLPSNYDDGGRRDPFVSLVTKKAAGGEKPKGGTGLASIAVADVAVKGIVKAGARVTVILEGPDHMSYMAHLQDRLADGLVKSIDPAGVVFVEEETDAAGAVHPHEVRKPLHAAAEVVK